MAAICNSVNRKTKQKLLQTPDVINNMTKEAKKTPEDVSEIQEAESRSMVNYHFEDRLSSKLSPGYTK